MNNPRIVVMGRPNVGKSTLFNRLLGSRKALVHDRPGVTRDLNEGDVEWFYEGKRRRFTLIDTGGIGGELFDEEIREQVGIAVREADAVLLVLDGRAGCVPLDEEVFQRFERARGKREIPVFGVVNKVDMESLNDEAMAEFYALGIPLIPVSAEHGWGIEDIRENVARAVPGEESIRSEESRLPRIAIVGRPNVGKSTLSNSLLGRKRSITSPIAGTTIDSIESEVRIGGRWYSLIDTAGIRRKSKTEKGVEVLSVIQAQKALEKADVAILLIDGVEGPTDQDEKIGGLIEEAGCAVVIAVNKWDLQKDVEGFSQNKAAEILQQQMSFLQYAPIVFVSALYSKGFAPLSHELDRVLTGRETRISTRELTDWVKEQAQTHNPENAKFYLSHQVGSYPPSFVFHVNDPKKIHFSARRRIANNIRKRWGFAGNPLRLKFTRSNRGLMNRN